ncbi:MAG: hypothetical protein EHJ95_07870 [Methanobacteriota archaeon]|nr:MAG: hypothetical protein EHJ95_07870 [Euryarchaeota archaeon]
MNAFDPIMVNVLSSLITKIGERILNSPFFENPKIVIPQRERLGDSFYESHYQKAREVEITGVVLGGIIRHICMVRSGMNAIPKTHLIANLKRRVLHTRLLLVHPDSEFIQERMILEKNPYLLDDIKKSLDALNGLKEFLSSIPREDRTIRGSLEIRLLKDRLPFSHFSVKPDNQKAAMIFLGLMLPGLKGYQCPIICIKDRKEQSDLYDVIEHQVFSLYNARETTPAFYWDGDVVQ